MSRVPPPIAPAEDERRWAMLAHVLTLAGHLVAFGSFIPPLVILFAKQDESPFVADQAKESLNFQITILIGLIASWIATLTVLLACVGIPMLIALYLGDIVLAIVAGIRANRGITYRYPVALRFLR